MARFLVSFLILFSSLATAAGTTLGAMNLPHQNFLSQQGKVWCLNSDTIAGQL